jgi:hypothetical protein
LACSPAPKGAGHCPVGRHAGCAHSSVAGTSTTLGPLLSNVIRTAWRCTGNRRSPSSAIIPLRGPTAP